jgi:hypothetical protein
MFLVHWKNGLCVPADNLYRGADKSLVRPTSRCISFDGENISFDASLYIYITNIPPIVIINRLYETQNLLSLELGSFLDGTYQHSCRKRGRQFLATCSMDNEAKEEISFEYEGKGTVHPITGLEGPERE